MTQELSAISHIRVVASTGAPTLWFRAVPHEPDIWAPIILQALTNNSGHEH